MSGNNKEEVIHEFFKTKFGDQEIKSMFYKVLKSIDENTTDNDSFTKKDDNRHIIIMLDISASMEENSKFQYAEAFILHIIEKLKVSAKTIRAVPLKYFLTYD